MRSLELVAEALGGEDAWPVGGAVRDRLLGRSVVDFDVACREPERAARALRARAGDAVFPLNERFGAWRVLLKGTGDRSARPVPLRAHQYTIVDFSPLRGDSIESDLAERDFTANAIAVPVAGGDYVDPFGGRTDIDDRVLRIVADRVMRGPFITRDGLRRVTGVGPVLIAKIDSLVTFTGTVAQPSIADTIVTRGRRIRAGRPPKKTG